MTSCCPPNLVHRAQPRNRQRLLDGVTGEAGADRSSEHEPSASLSFTTSACGYRLITAASTSFPIPPWREHLDNHPERLGE